ncbi:hypothetical protein K5I29_03210 [Flavobacterium agricola]|uniref:DoxX-like protein n=1 Tax=Flavobacterium agricola TaxID=2870839 RepID=A0ABY6M110_9FLAO|nr:hypothetical protein [Flavobacterium agricola]UYW01937.1 hypothetical protein K5I29_03210 [Flavobacterium agricola]
MNFKTIFAAFCFKDFIRILCGILLITRAMLFIIDGSFLVPKNVTESSLFFSFSVIYLFSIVYLILGVLLLFGIKTKKQLAFSIFLLVITFILAFLNHNFLSNDMLLCSLIFILLLYLFFGGSGNATVDKLFTD